MQDTGRIFSVGPFVVCEFKAPLTKDDVLSMRAVSEIPSIARRRTLALLGASSIGLVGCLSRDGSTGSFERVAGEWPVNGNESGRTRSVNEGPTDPTTVWTSELDDARTTSTPSIADGRIYVPVDAVTDRARHRFRLYALEARTGEEHWHVPLRADPNSAPAIGSRRIIVSAQRQTDLGRIVAFDDRYGHEEWVYDIDARVTAAPMIADRTVFVPDWGGDVHALSITDGTVRWSQQVGSNERDRTFPSPTAVHDETLYVGSYSGRTGVIAVDAATGDDLWTQPTGRVLAGPVVDDRLVVVRDDSVVRAFETDGTERWTFSVPDGYGTPLALDDQHVYVPTRDTLHTITRGGEKAWTYELADGRVGPPTVVGDEVLVDEEETLTALRRADGTTQWSVETDSSGDAITTTDAIAISAPGGRVTALGAE